jgi:hypothetical protein
MSTTDFGPVETVWYNPQDGYQQTAAVDGISDVTISGAMPLLAAQTLFELVNNRGGRTTVRGRTGVLETFTCPYPVVEPFNGPYLFHSFAYTPYKFSDGTLAANFTLQASYLAGLT